MRATGRTKPHVLLQCLCLTGAAALVLVGGCPPGLGDGDGLAKYALCTSVQGEGSIEVEPSGVLHDAGTEVTLTAVPADGWEFSHWEGDLTGSDNPATLTMDGNKDVTAVFTAAVSGYTLTVTIDGEGSVELDPEGGTYEEGEATEVTLTAVPAAEWIFDSWDGDLDGQTNPETIVMDEDKEVTAIFVKPDKLFDGSDDFDLGQFIGLEFDAVAGVVQISDEVTTFPFIWVPNSNEGTISKVDTETGDELGRYRVCPEDLAGDPSRTTVDLAGSCYVANRNTGTVVKVGLYENGGYVDRNGNGTIETSMDVDGDGDITGDELLAWGEDECVLWETVLTTADEGPYVPGEYPGTYPYGHWNPGTRGIAIDASNNVWAGVYGTRMYYYLNGETGEIIRTVDVSDVNHTAYGAVIDSNGILWSSGQDKQHVLRLDPSDDSYRTVAPGHFVYGLGVDLDNHLFISGWTDSRLSRVDVTAAEGDEVEWNVAGVYESRGVAVTDDGNVWTADSSPGTVTRWSNDGDILATIAVGNTPTGVAVDAAGKVWVVNFGDEYIKRIDPATDTIDLEKAIVGTRHYGYSDMTGIVARTVSTRIGNWTVNYDSSEDGALWQTLRWLATLPDGTVITVRVRSSDDLVIWSEWVEVTTGADLSSIPAGQYLQIEVTLQILEGDQSPTFGSLSVFTQD